MVPGPIVQGLHALHKICSLRNTYRVIPMEENNRWRDQRGICATMPLLIYSDESASQYRCMLSWMLPGGAYPDTESGEVMIQGAHRTMQCGFLRLDGR